MSDPKQSTEEASAETPKEEPKPEPAKKPKEAKTTKCSQSPTGEHDVFHNEGTGEKYCRYCGQ